MKLDNENMKDVIDFIVCCGDSMLEECKLDSLLGNSYSECNETPYCRLRDYCRCHVVPDDEATKIFDVFK